MEKLTAQLNTMNLEPSYSVDDLMMALSGLNIRSPFEKMIDGLFGADLFNVIDTILKLTQIMDPTSESSNTYGAKDTRNELIRCYAQVMDNPDRLFINPDNTSYFRQFQSNEPIRIFQTVFFDQMSILARYYKDFRSKSMSVILDHALQLNDPLYMLRLDHRQLANSAARFILWLSYYSVLEGHISSMLTDDIQDNIVRLLTRIHLNEDNYYTTDLQETIDSLKA